MNTDTTNELLTELAEIDFDLDPELTEEQLSLIMQTWPWSMRDVMGRWLGGACNRAGITSKRQRYALQEQLMRLFGEA